ncbi:MAG TPA: secretin N-terminal domain-containing protein [Tepidisphaeraceae bacterium]|jgi:general secretion pathway protein D
MRPLAVSLLLCLGLAGFTVAQPATADKPVPMEFPAEGVELRTLADIVTKRLKIPILYDESINNKKVIIRVPVDLPEAALLGVLQSALRMKQMALVDADVPGWKQIVSAQNLAAVAKPALAAGAQAGAPIIQVFQLKQADPARIVETVRPFLTAGGQIQPVSGQRAVIVTDYPAAAARVEQVINTLDEGTAAEVKFVPVKNADAVSVAQTVQQILSGKEGGAPGAQVGAGIVVTPDERTGQVIVIAPKARMQEVTDLIAGVDKPVETETRVYRLRAMAPERVDRLVKGLLGSAAAKRAYQSTIDKDSQSLVVSATSDVHKRIDALVKELDKPIAEDQSPIQFYKLKNTKAADVLATISSLMGEQASVVQPAGGLGDGSYGRSLLSPPEAPNDNRLPIRPPTGYQPLTPGADAVLSPGSVLARPRSEDLGPMSTMSAAGAPATARPAAGAAAASVERSTQGSSAQGTGEGEEGGSAAGRAKSATVTADVNSNSIIVIAPPAVQQLYAGLISRLDERRPQVQVECTIVTLDTTDDFSFGVDISKLGGFGSSTILSFSSFGVSTVDPVTAKLTPIGKTGGTFALLSPGIANVVIQALQSNSRARLVSAPQLLVNDNGKGKLQSVSQEPFAEILDTSTTQSRTGLGGLAQAGTTITVEPHISEGDYLQLSYSIELSNFTGTGRNGLPPPSQKNSVDSTVTVPDGNTIVVGGLKVKNFRESKDTIPFINQIPFADWVFGSRARNITDTTLFVFIKPVILRDDKFEDLKYLSDKALHGAGMPGRYPASYPIPIR